MKTQYIKKNNVGTFYYSDKTMTNLHREDGPAVEYSDGTKSWYLNGQLHREDGPAAEWADGKNKEWYLNGQLHREDGPAVEWASGTKSWYLNGQLHREDGPAVEWASGTKSWYLNGQPLSKEEWEKRTGKKKTININGKAFTIEELNALIASVK
jgi:antitoxin component YwqK of YwqJK toxin-antitoxin module